MIKKELKGLDIKVYEEQLDNGLKIFLVPLKNRKNYQINYFTKYGAAINEFISLDDNKKVKVPYGVAHFLEHKMFEQESGEDPFSYFAKFGSDANAYTSYRVTAYIVEGSSEIEKNITYLLDYVNSPYFTDENVEKEKGIIIEEINMYKDEPEGKLYDESNKAVFQKHPCRVDVGGTPKSVRSITKEVLYKCYNTFYQPSNMYFVLVGNFDVKSVLKTIKNNKKLNNRESNMPITTIKVNEPKEVNTRSKELNIKNIAIPKSILTFKTLLKSMSGEERFKYKMSVDILLYLLFGTSSPFREDMLNKNLMTFLYSSKSIIDDIMLIELTSESKDPKKLFKECMKRIKDIEITKEDIERVKKVKIANEVYATDKVSMIMGMINSYLVDQDEVIYNRIDLIKSITLEDVLNVKKDIDLDNYSFVIGYPKE